MKILIVNDDSIYAPGIVKLAEAAKKFGDVYVIAPAHECSGTAMKLSFNRPMELCEYSEFPVEGVKAWRLDGTPVDCVKLGVDSLLPEKPDWVFSGLNFGYNAGRDSLYSATMGGAIEGSLNGIPSVAFSMGIPSDYFVSGEQIDYSLADRYLEPVIAEILSQPRYTDYALSVNFPTCAVEDCRGIKRDVKLSPRHLYTEKHYYSQKDGKTYVENRLEDPNPDAAEAGTDIYELLRGYITICKVYNALSAGK